MVHRIALKALRDGRSSWEDWRRRYRTPPDLAGVDLAGADLRGFDLKETNLCGANLSRADLSYSTFYSANLSSCDLSSARAKGAIFTDANLTSTCLDAACLIGANFSGANLQGASFVETDLCTCNLSGAIVAQSRFVRTKVWDTCFAKINLAPAVLQDLDYQGPCDVGVLSLELTARSLKDSGPAEVAVEAFLRGCGMPQGWIEYFRSLVGSPIRWYSAFISYSHADACFARRLYDQLQGKGIRCWLDEHDLTPGQRILDAVDQAIRITDRVLLCCSRSSLESWWVKDEIRKTHERERLEQRDLIIPLNLDDFLLAQWSDGLASDLRSRLAADFTGWERDNKKFERQFQKVVKALQPSKETA